MVSQSCYHHRSYTFVLISLSMLFSSKGISAATFTFINKCDYTVWPGMFGTPKLDSTGFELPRGTTRSFQAPTGWSGRFWGRTGCTFDSSGKGTCATADCGSGEVECNGATAQPPATLAEFTLGSGSQDFYDVSLVDGYNIQMMVDASGGNGDCTSTGCVTDLNKKCPSELRIDGGAACKSACDAFGNPEYCCKGEFNSPATCKPSMYSEMFKSACPRSYSYAYDDATSTFTCTGADYTITFCPSKPSVKSASDPAPTAIGSTSGSASGGTMGSTEGGDTESEGSAVQESALASAWLANLATGDSTRTTHFSSLLKYAVLLLTSIILCHVPF